MISDDGIGIDISLGTFPYKEGMTERADYKVYLPDVSLRICTAEDLIVLKAFAARGRDWEDIITVIIKQDSLDRKYIYKNLEPLAEIKYEPEIVDRLRELRSK